MPNYVLLSLLTGIIRSDDGPTMIIGEVEDAIAIIGGADGPTAILVTSDPTAWLVIAILAVVIVGLIALYFVKIKNRKKKKYRPKKKHDDADSDENKD